MTMNTESIVTVEKAAEIIGITTGRVRQLLLSKELDGVKMSERVWLVNRKDAEKLAKKPPATGRPRSAKKND